MKKIITLLVSFLSFQLFAQEKDIIPFLKAIEEGKRDEVLNKLPALKKDNPSDPSIMFLDGILKENAGDALLVFNIILEKYPRSKYADAALYRIYSFDFASGLYNSAEKHLDHMKSEYPGSPYIKIADRNIPDDDEPGEEMLMPGKDTKQGQQYKFTIQAGAFSNRNNSSALADEFRSAGYDTEIKEKLIAGTAFEVVYVGKFMNENEARNFLNQINSRFNLDGRIVSLNNAN